MENQLEEHAALKACCDAAAECRELVTSILSQMEYTQKDDWVLIFERAMAPLADSNDAWVDEMEAAYENLLYLIYDCHLSPADILKGL